MPNMKVTSKAKKRVETKKIWFTHIVKSHRTLFFITSQKRANIFQGTIAIACKK
jgi:hypothetical protein